MSSGPLTQLVAIGSQDYNFISNDVRDSIFYESNKKINNFVKSVHSMQPLGNSNWGTTTKFKIEKKGDLLNNLYFVAKLPELKFTDLNDVSQQDYLFSWVNHIGYVLIENVKLFIGGQLIDQQSGEIIKILDETNNDGGWREISRVDTEYYSLNLPNRVQIISDYVYVPLQFWFCKNIRKSLPLIALQYHDVEIEVKIRDFESCYRVIKERTYNNQNLTDLPNLELIRTHYQFANKFKQLPLEGVRLDCTYVYLDSNDRKRISQSEHKILITQNQEIKCNLSEKSIDLDFNHPVKDLYFYLSLNYIKNLPEPLNFSANSEFLFNNTAEYHLDTKNVFPNRNYGWNNGSGVLKDFLPLKNRHLLEEARILINGHQRVEWKDYKYYSYVQNNEFYKRCIDNHVYKYSFSGNPHSETPLGSLNFSRIDNAQLQVKINDNTINLIKKFMNPVDYSKLNDNNINITINAINYNYLIIKSGMGGLAYNN